jgi:hypothetical protein
MSLPSVWQALCLWRNRRKMGMLARQKCQNVQRLTENVISHKRHKKHKMTLRNPLCFLCLLWLITFIEEDGEMAADVGLEQEVILF